MRCEIGRVRRRVWWWQVAKHLTKLFDSMAKLRFRQENEQDTKIALYMSSKDGEEVKLAKPCDCDGQVTDCNVNR